MATQPKLEIVPPAPSFEDTLDHIVALRSAILQLAIQDAASIDMKLAFRDNQPAFAIALHLNPMTEPHRTKLTLEANQIGGYRFVDVASKRDGNSLTKHIVTAMVVKGDQA